MAKTEHPPCTCILCGASFVPAIKRRSAQYCTAPACRSEMHRRSGIAGLAARWQKRELIKPPATACRTVLQPQMAAYIERMAAAGTSMAGAA